MSDEGDGTAYQGAYDARVRADRMAAGLGSLVDPVAGDLEAILQLRAHLAQHEAGLTRLRALVDKWDRPFRGGSCCMEAADGAVFDCMLELHVALADLPDAPKEKP